MSSELITRLTKTMHGLPQSGTIMVMPDFFVDRFVRVDSLDQLVLEMKRKSFEGGGGSVRGISQTEVKGGNAVNVAYTLGMLGADVVVAAIADSMAAGLLVATFSGLPNVDLQVIPGRAGYTVAFEFKEHGRHVNVMISDVGDLVSFDGFTLQKRSIRAIKKSKIVAIVNWAANKKGNELCSRIFSLAKENGAKTFFDPADVSGQRDLLPDLKHFVFDRGLVDFVSMNENEARIISKELFDHELPMSHSTRELIEAAKILSNGTGACVDLHTQNVTVSANGCDAIAKRCHKVVQRTVTGAGDIWAAANLACYLSRADPEDRLSFANAAAGLYVSRESATTPSLKEIFDFMRSNKVH